MIIWLASYPRSGNTFLRVLLNHVFGTKTYSIYDDRYGIGADRKLSDVVGHEFLPTDFDLEQARKSRKLYFIKTHDGPENIREDRVIYILRDGRESILSFCKYLLDYNGQSTPLVDMVNGHTPYGSWGEHVSAWNPGTRENTLLIQFEKVTADPHVFIDDIAEFIGVKPVSRKIPTFNELHKKGPKFFRSGKTDSWKNEYSETDHNTFWLRNYKQMVEYGYTSDMPELFETMPGLATVFQVLSSQQEHIAKQNHEQLSLIDQRISGLQAEQMKGLHNLEIRPVNLLDSIVSQLSDGQLKPESHLESEPTGVVSAERGRIEPEQSTAMDSDQAAVTANEQGESFFRMGDLEKAEGKFIEAIQHDPDSADGYNNLGVLWWQRNDVTKALEFLTAGLNIKPDHRELILNTAAILKSLGKIDEAGSLCESYLNQYPQDSELRSLYESLALIA